LLALVKAESLEALFKLGSFTHPDDPEFVA
jgi:hypothetical protein